MNLPSGMKRSIPQAGRFITGMGLQKTPCARTCSGSQILAQPRPWLSVGWCVCLPGGNQPCPGGEVGGAACLEVPIRTEPGVGTKPVAPPTRAPGGGDLGHCTQLSTKHPTAPHTHWLLMLSYPKMEQKEHVDRGGRGPTLPRERLKGAPPCSNLTTPGTAGRFNPICLCSTERGTSDPEPSAAEVLGGTRASYQQAGCGSP